MVGDTDGNLIPVCPFCPCHHTPENPAQEKDGGHTCNGTDCDCLLRRAQEECCELCDMWTKDGTNHYCANSRCTCHETNKPPIYEHWEAEFDQYWQADGLGGTYVQLAFMKRFIRNLLEAEKGASVEFIAVHKDDWMKEGATSERARIKKVSENLVLHRLPMYEQEMYFQGYTPYGAYRLAIDDIKAVLEWKLKIVE